MDASCVICCDLFTGVLPEILHSTSCGHVFHFECLMKWLQRSETCPICRAKVTKTSTKRFYFQLRIKEAKKLKEKNKLPRVSVDLQTMESLEEGLNRARLELEEIKVQMKSLKNRLGEFNNTQRRS